MGKAGLLNAVWPGVTVEENSLNHAISAVRRALGDSRREPRFIATIQGRGYQFIAPVGTAAAEGGGAAPGAYAGRAANAAADTGTLLAPRSRSPCRAGMAVGLLMVSITLLGLYLIRPAHQSRQGQSATPANSIAVMPWELPNVDEAYAYLAPGLHAETTTQLDKIPNLIVIQATTVKMRDGAALSLEKLDEALMRDPDFVDAWVRKAIALDENSIRAHVALSDALLGQGDIGNAYEEYLIARERDSGYAMVLVAAGYLDEAEVAAEEWRGVDPANSSGLSVIASLQNKLGEPEKALETYEYAKALIPDCRTCDFTALIIFVGLDDEDRLDDFLARRDLILPEINQFRRLEANPDEYEEWLRSVLPGNRWPSRLLLSAIVVSAMGNAELIREVLRLAIDLWRAHGWPTLCRPLEGDDFECV